MMAIRAWWNSLVTTWKKLRPARRRRTLAGHSVEAFEPRRLLSAFVVNSLADSHDAIPGDGIAADTNGQTTLRAALEEANAHAGADTITLPAGIIAVSPANGPLVVTDDVTLIGSGNTTIDGSAVDQVFSVVGVGHLQLDHVTVQSTDVAAASLRSNFLTTNHRQADLIVAFSATPSAPFTAEIKTSTGLSPLIGSTIPESFFDEAPVATALKSAKTRTPLGELAVPTPDEAIDQIINALFRNEPDLIVPAGAEQKAESNAEVNGRPMPKADAEDAMPDDEQSSIDTDDEAVGTVLRGWANDAGWREFDFLTRQTTAVTLAPRPFSRVVAMAGMLVGSVAATTWSRDEDHSWRGSLSWSAWRTRIERLRRRAR
jgi:hypothetical protein